MSTLNLYEELFVFALLLLGVVGIYYALKIHYVFAFGLVKNTSISEIKKQKIEKIKIYVFIFLKVLLSIGFITMFIFGVFELINGVSLKGLVTSWWQKIPEEFWFSLLWTLTRIAILIILMRYLLKIIYRFLDKQQKKTLDKKRYNSDNIIKAYLRIHNIIKYTVVLGVVYRIIHFFPFLEEMSKVFLAALVLFFSTALLITVREVILMRKSDY